MRSVTYSMGVSLDGYIAGPDGDITAPPPDDVAVKRDAHRIGHAAHQKSSSVTGSTI